MSTHQFGETISEQVNTGILILDLNFNIVQWNRFFQMHAHQHSSGVIGNNIFDVFAELPRKWLERKLSSVVQLKTPNFCSWEQRHHLFELSHTRPITTDSHFMAQNCTFLPIEVDGEVKNIGILIEDVTDVCHYQSKLNHALEELAKANRIDGLTQVFNRKHWEECLEKEFSRARRYGHGLTLIMFDLDRFKLLNDTYGHQCGDKVLVDTAQLIKSLLRLCDQFGRYGGEEFAAILPETELSAAVDVAQRIRQQIENTSINFHGEIISVSVSVGVAAINQNDRRYEDLISNADIALYQAKSAGRNRVCVAEEPEEQLVS